MKAIRYSRYGTPDVLECVDMPSPVAGPGELLIQVEMISVGPGDCKTRAGLLHGYHPAAFPKIPGRSGVGRVVRVGDAGDAGDSNDDTNGTQEGKDVPPAAAKADAWLGKRVYFSTSHSETGCCVETMTRRPDQVVVVDPALDAAGAAALIHPASCAWQAFFATAQLAQGQRVLILGGAGAIGLQAVQLAVQAGAQVHATASAKNLALLRSLNVTEAIDYGSSAYERYFTEHAASFDVIFDLVGGDTHRRSFASLKSDGVLVYLTADPIGTVPPSDASRQRLVQLGNGMKVAETVIQLAASGKLRAMVGRILPLAQCAEAHRLIESKQQGPGRVLLQA